MCALLLLLNIELVRIISVAGFNSSLFILTGIQCVVHSTIVAICSTVDGHLGGTRGHRSAAMSILVYMFWCMYVHTCVRYTPRSETELVAGNYKAQVLDFTFLNEDGVCPCQLWPLFRSWFLIPKLGMYVNYTIFSETQQNA